MAGKKVLMGCPEELELNDKVRSGGSPICPLTGGLQCALTETRETVIRLATKFDEQVKDLHTLKLDVYGNGKPGLKTEVVKLRMVMGGVKWAAGVLGGALLLDIALRLITVLAPHAPVATDATTKVLGGG